MAVWHSKNNRHKNGTIWVNLNIDLFHAVDVPKSGINFFAEWLFIFGSFINIRMNLSAICGRIAQNASLRFAKISEQLIPKM